LNVGDIVTTYHKGIWRITAIKAEIAYYSQVMTSDFKPGKKMSKCCHTSFCRPVDQKWIDNKREELFLKMDSLVDLEKLIET
jgi:hypothetical protein